MQVFLKQNWNIMWKVSTRPLFHLTCSFNMTCILCTHANRNLWRYVIAAYLPLTLIIFFFMINIISTHLFAIIVVSQIATVPAVSRLLLNNLNTDPYAGSCYIAFVRVGTWTFSGPTILISVLEWVYFLP